MWPSFQYLNCKILHGGRFCSIDRILVKIRHVARISQRERLFWKFDPILFDLQKKRSLPKFKRFFWPKSQIQGFFLAKKKSLRWRLNCFFSASLFPRNLVLYLTGLWASFPSHLPSLKSRWGRLNLDEVTFNLDRGRVPPFLPTI